MKPVFQTVVDKDHGNCEQATIASLLELKLEEVPNFIEHQEKSWFTSVVGFLHSKGFDACCINRRRDESTEFLQRVARFDKGYKGCFYASIPSQTFEGVSHAVIVDENLKIIHDPNPNQKALLLTADDVEYIIVMNPMIIGKTGKLFTQEEWDNTTDEERDLNTHRASDLTPQK